MKVQVRTGAFETNSSSMHALLIMKKRQVMTQQEIRDEFYLDAPWREKKNNILKLDAYDNYFGRGFDVLTSFRQKLSYALASLCGDCHSLKNYIHAGDRFETDFAPLLEELVGVDDVEMPMDTAYFSVYSDSITDDEYQDYNTYEEVPYEDLIHNEDNDDGVEGFYKEVCKSGRKQETIWLSVPDFGGIDHQSSFLLQGFLRKYGITLKEFLIRKDIVVVVDSDESCIFGMMLDSGLVDKGAIQIAYGGYERLNSK